MYHTDSYIEKQLGNTVDSINYGFTKGIEVCFKCIFLLLMLHENWRYFSKEIRQHTQVCGLQQKRVERP